MTSPAPSPNESRASTSDETASRSSTSSRRARRLSRGRILHRVFRRLHRISIYVGVLMTMERFFFLIGLLLLTAWSYSVWGSEYSPLRHLFIPALVMLGLALTIQIFVWVALKWLRRAAILNLRRARVRDRIRSQSKIVKQL